MKRPYRYSLLTLLLLSTVSAVIFAVYNYYEQYYQYREPPLPTNNQELVERSIKNLKSLGRDAHRDRVRALPSGQLEHWKKHASFVKNEIARHAFERRFPIATPSVAYLCDSGLCQIACYGLDSQYGVAVKYSMQFDDKEAKVEDWFCLFRHNCEVDEVGQLKLEGIPNLLDHIQEALSADSSEDIQVQFLDLTQ